MSSAALMLGAWAIEAVTGWPQPLYRRIGHPVSWLGWIIARLEILLNRPAWPHCARYMSGAAMTCLLVAGVAGLASAISRALPDTVPGFVIEAAMASSLIASRSLHAHVADVARPLMGGDLETARQAVAWIVGRDPACLDEAGIARAGLESLSENLSDGVIAPVVWGLAFGLPGIAAYKAVNTLDSMIGHRSPRYAAFGGFAARLDDLANLVPARLSGLLIVVSAASLSAARLMVRDAGHHRSPNAGWPEAAMAGALNVRLSGPRNYGGCESAEPWLNAGAEDPLPADMRRGLTIYKRVCGLALACLAVLAVLEGAG